MMGLGRWLVVGAGILAAACAPTLGPVTPSVQVLVVLDSLDDSLRVIPIDSPLVVHTIALHPRAGNEVATAMALSGSKAAIATGSDIQVLDLGNSHLTICGPDVNGIPGTAPITAIAFGDDGFGYAASPTRNSVARFPTLQQTGCAGGYDSYSGAPQGFGVARGAVFVIASSCPPASLSNCQSWLTSYPHSADSIPLAPPGNSRAAIFGPDGFLYVINAGSDSVAGGTLSQIDPLQKSGIGGPSFPGFGHLPSYLATNYSDKIYVSSPVDSGLMVFNVRTHLVEKSYANPVALGGRTRGLATDDAGRVYALLAGSCGAGTGRGSVHILGPDLVATRDVPVGRCPIAIGVTEIPAAAYRFVD